MDLNQVTIPSNDVEKSVRFYQNLGLRLIVDSMPRYARFECPEGNSTFSVHFVETPLSPENGISIYFECKDLDANVLKLEQNGITFDLSPTDQRWLWREARLKDPDGNQLILFHAGDNRKNPPWRIDA